jgi:predicted DNA-binding ribbon-helix-helix protein
VIKLTDANLVKTLLANKSDLQYVTDVAISSISAKGASELFKRMPRLEKVRVGLPALDVIQPSWSFLAEHKATIHTLNLHRAIVTTGDAVKLSEWLPNLLRLTLSQCAWGNNMMPPFHGWTKLQFLQMELSSSSRVFFKALDHQLPPSIGFDFVYVNGRQESVAEEFFNNKLRIYKPIDTVDILAPRVKEPIVLVRKVLSSVSIERALEYQYFTDLASIAKYHKISAETLIAVVEDEYRCYEGNLNDAIRMGVAKCMHDQTKGNE